MPDSAPAREMPATRLDRIRAAQVAALYRTAPTGVVGALVGAAVLAAILLYRGSLSAPLAWGWVLAIMANMFVHLELCRRYARARPAEPAWRPWADRFTAVSLSEGIGWGLGSVLLITPGALDTQLIVMLVVTAVASSAIPAFGTYLPASLAFMFPAMLPFLGWSLVQGDGFHLGLAALDLVFVAAVGRLAVSSNASFTGALALRFENLELAEDLRRQKERAEQANLAKSRFLAAASHDLRQPVHALTMFVGALKGRAMDGEARRLVEHIDGSVTALDGLFTALLDISRLDAGVVQTRLANLPIRPLMERVYRDHQAEAAAKGLRLALRAGEAVVRSDPVLLERILRNIVSNAVRYTDRGGILVAARRRGALLRLEVWDTGRGIPAAEQERVFQEFYQLGNPERDRSKGLGLGLAIVRRLTVLLDCPLSLRSVPGRGSVFQVAVPLVAEGAPMAEPAAEPPARALAQGLILVIDDEAAIQEAMRSLLMSWGHEVIVAGSEAEMLERVATVARRPDLIICDYRLRAPDNGIAAIRRLQSEFNDDIPAVLITGDTAPDRLAEAQESGFLLLHKPLAHAKLRAAIGNLMSAERAEG